MSNYNFSKDAHPYCDFGYVIIFCSTLLLIYEIWANSANYGGLYEQDVSIISSQHPIMRAPYATNTKL